MIKHLIKIDGELFEIPLKVYNHLEQQKQRADELQKLLNEKSEGNKSLLNRIDELTTVIEELHISNSGFCEQTELSKQRADRAEKLWSALKNTVNEFHQEAIFEETRSNDDGDRGIIFACEKILGKISDLE